MDCAITECQKEAFEKLSKLRCGALFMEAGTGKTRTAVELVRSKLVAIDKVLWLAPASLLNTQNYMDEINKWCDFTDKLIFKTIEGVGSSKRIYAESYTLCDNSKIFLVVDESLTIKNPGAKRTLRAITLANKCTFRLILNGTPISRSILDLYTQIKLLSPLILGMTERQFAYKFIEYKNDGGYCPWRRYAKAVNEAALIEIIKPYVFDAKLDLGIKITSRNEFAGLDSREVIAYERIKKDFEEKFQAEEGPDFWFLGMCAKLQNSYSACKERLNICKKEIENYNGKIIIYCRFLSEIELLKNITDCVVYTGKEKNDLGIFINSKKVMLCTYGCGSLGLNLQCASKIIFFSATFDYKAIDQSTHRIYRTGQTRDCEIVNLYVTTGLESIMRKCIDNKKYDLKYIKKLIEAKGLKNL